MQRSTDGRNAACLAFLALLGCSSEPSDGVKYVAAHEAVAGRLRDPGSAVFRNDHLGSYQGREVVCGEVNSTNGFGGMTGFQRYLSNGGEATVVEEQMDPAEFATVWSQMGC